MLVNILLLITDIYFFRNDLETAHAVNDELRRRLSKYEKVDIYLYEFDCVDYE